jgi:hypothetical protein
MSTAEIVLSIFLGIGCLLAYGKIRLEIEEKRFSKIAPKMGNRWEEWLKLTQDERDQLVKEYNELVASMEEDCEDEEEWLKEHTTDRTAIEHVRFWQKANKEL